MKALHFLRRLGVALLYYLFSHQLFYTTLGWLNERLDFIGSVFVAYPASKSYADAYFFDFIKHKIKWSPILCALLYQNGKWTLGMGISALEDELRYADEEDLRFLVEQAERIRRTVGADHKTFAGILPGILHRRGIVREATEAEVTVRIILNALEIVKRREDLPADVPLIVLGGDGHIGTRLTEAISDELVHSVEKVNPGEDWPGHLEGEEALLINVATSEALSEYMDRVWPGVRLLNEAYPPPNGEKMKVFTQHNSAYHVVGVKASAYPSFPKRYAGAIPCCAARPCEEMEAIVRQL